MEPDLKELAASGHPVVVLQRGANGLPTGAWAAQHIHAPPARVWEVVQDLDAYAERIPLVNKVRRTGNQVDLQLKFKIALFSAKFGFQTTLTTDDESWLELKYVSGEPRDINLRFDVAKVDDPNVSFVSVKAEFDIQSLGFLVKFFLKHHPEIQFGVFPGTTLVLLESLRRAVE